MKTPSKEPAAVALGRQGGRVGGRASTPAKRKAARANGRLGGRPRKPFNAVEEATIDLVVALMVKKYRANADTARPEVAEALVAARRRS